MDLQLIELLNKVGARAEEIKKDLRKKCDNPTFKNEFWKLGKAEGYPDLLLYIEAAATRKAKREFNF